VSVNRGVTGGTSQVLVLSVRDVEVCLGVPVLLGETEVDHVDLVASLADAHEEVVGLDVTVDEALGVDVLDAADQLVGQQQDGLEGEFAVAEVEEVLEGGSEQVENHGVVVALGAEPPDEGNADTAGERLVDTSLIFELGVLGLDRLKLDGNLLTGDDVGAWIGRLAGSRHGGILLHSLTKVDVTETAASDLTTDAVLVTHAEVLHVVSGVVHDLAVGMCEEVQSRVGRGVLWARTMVVMFVIDLAEVECVGRWRTQ
jgi:hypothetical protein